MGRNEGPARIAVIRAVPGKENQVRYAKVRDRIETSRYHSILDALRMHGAQRIEAEDAAKWVYRKAETGETREIWPGIEIVIEEVEEGE
jgi:hypothetical protein